MWSSATDIAGGFGSPPFLLSRPLLPPLYNSISCFFVLFIVLSIYEFYWFWLVRTMLTVQFMCMRNLKQQYGWIDSFSRTCWNTWIHWVIYVLGQKSICLVWKWYSLFLSVQWYDGKVSSSADPVLRTVLGRFQGLLSVKLHPLRQEMKRCRNDTWRLEQRGGRTEVTTGKVLITSHFHQTHETSSSELRFWKRSF